MLFYGDFRAWITIGDDETPAVEYGVTENQSENTMIAYIASEEGQRFQVGWCDNRFTSPTRGRVSIDGRGMGGKIISESTYNKSVVKKGFRTNKDERRPFVFSKLQVTDEEVAFSSSSKPGEIILVIIRVRMKGTTNYDRSHNPPPTRIFNEKDVKGLDAHSTACFSILFLHRPMPHLFLQVRRSYSSD
ncbi:hypothetical protein BT96DRAFT_920516 [Gymnopus androsaceus JB14]|uniref:DUF7918 domain-containing protein n=1 Tax=Gymnopus androsaceus JB14 TaxID=1447944 RepID=A0A6A4HLM4_9AGAR|nr:hypothetical protein BT96DRAFT_920516 [Gymnopus androsaceus JB14]